MVLGPRATFGFKVVLAVVAVACRFLALQGSVWRTVGFVEVYVYPLQLQIRLAGVAARGVHTVLIADNLCERQQRCALTDVPLYT